MTEAEKWRTLARILAVTVPVGTLIGLGLAWLNGGAGAPMAAGAVIGLLITAGIGTFNVSWSVGLIPRRWGEAPFLVVLLTRSLVWLVVIVVAVSLPLLTVAGLSIEDLVDQQFGHLHCRELRRRPGHLSRRIRCTRLHHILRWSHGQREMWEWASGGWRARRGIRTPDLVIRSPMPAEAASLPYFVLNRAVRTAGIRVRSR